RAGSVASSWGFQRPLDELADGHRRRRHGIEQTRQPRRPTVDDLTVVDRAHRSVGNGDETEVGAEAARIPAREVAEAGGGGGRQRRARERVARWDERHDRRLDERLYNFLRPLQALPTPLG